MLSKSGRKNVLGTRKEKTKIVIHRSLSHCECILTSLVVMMMLMMTTAEKVLRIAIAIIVTAVRSLIAGRHHPTLKDVYHDDVTRIMGVSDGQWHVTLGHDWPPLAVDPKSLSGQSHCCPLACYYCGLISTSNLLLVHRKLLNSDLSDCCN